MRVSPQARKKGLALPDFLESTGDLTLDARGRERVPLTLLWDRRRYRDADIVAC
jgi:hypothetical protein